MKKMGLIISASFLLVILGASCAKFEKPPQVSYEKENTIPARLAVLPVTYLPVTAETPGDFPVDKTSEKGKFIAELARSVIHNQLAYTQSSLGEEENMVETLERGIADFPYEVRLHKVYIKYLAANGQKKKALTLLEKAMKMSPEDQNLVFMRQYVETME